MASLENPFEKAHRKMVAARLEFISQLAKFRRAELALTPETGDWSALTLANHLYIADALMLERLRLIAEEENPLLPDLEEETPRHTLAAEPPTSLEAVMAGMAARREELFEYLSALPPESWERPWRHPTWGQLKMYQLVNILITHDHTHAAQLAELKAALIAV